TEGEVFVGRHVRVEIGAAGNLEIQGVRTPALHRGELAVDPLVIVVGAEALVGGVRRGNQPVAAAREPGVVELIYVEQAPQPDRGLVHVGEDRGARFRTRVHPPPYQAQPGLAPSAEIGAAVEAETRLLRLVLADLVVAREYVAQFIADPGVGSDEPAAPRLDGLHELGREERLPADLDLGEPLAAQPVEPGPAVWREQVEGVFSLEVRRETQAEAEVVRPPLLLARLDDHDPPARLLPDLIVHALEIAAAVDAAQIRADLLLAQRLAGLGLEQRAQHFGAGPPQTLEADFVHHAHRLELGDLPAAQRFVLCRRQAVAAERLRQRARG